MDKHKKCTNAHRYVAFNGYGFGYGHGTKY